MLNMTPPKKIGLWMENVYTSFAIHVELQQCWDKQLKLKQRSSPSLLQCASIKPSRQSFVYYHSFTYTQNLHMHRILFAS